MINRLIKKVRGDALLSNSLLLMISSGVLAVLGFAFWSICVHIYTQDQVGVATALLAALNLITSLSLLGFEISIIRVLPKHQDRSALLNACLAITSILGLIFGAGFLLLQPEISPGLSIVRSSLGIVVLFLVFVLVSNLSYMFESVFISLRASNYVLIKNTIFSVAKLVLPAALVGLGAFGIYSSWMIALAVATAISAVTLVRKFGFKFTHHFTYKPLVGMMTYSFANYASSFAEGLPIMVLPLVILNLFGAAEAAHYYIAMMLATLLYTIPIAATQSMFAEGSHDEGQVRAQTVKATKITGLLLVPGILGLVVVGPLILDYFGKGYSDGTMLLYLLAASAILVAANSIARTVLKLRYRSLPLVWVSLAGSLLIVGLCYPLRGMGLTGVGISWVIGQAAMLLFYALDIVLAAPGSALDTATPAEASAAQ